MTNAQKYEEVFGFPPDKMCPTECCSDCPLHEEDDCHCEEWWNSEYEEVTIPDELERRTAPKDIIREIEQTGHSCGTCKYGQKSLTEEPCSSCDICLGNNKWEPKDEEDGDK